MLESTAVGCGVQVPVTVTGTSNANTCSLHVVGTNRPSFTWDGAGKSTYSGFVASYTGKGFGVTVSDVGLVVAPKATAPALLANISTRLRVQTGDNVLIGGFIVTGTQPKKVIIRAIGPSLALTGKLADPKLALYNSAGNILASNDDWQQSADKQTIIDSTVPPTNPKESAIVASLPPGAYTAIVSGVGSATGIALVEVYDLNTAADSRLANISTRGFVQTGNNVMIGGFILLGNAPQRVIIRAIGPSLPLAGKLADPALELHDPNGQLLAQNGDWVSDDPVAITATSVPPSNNKESAIVTTLVPGGYTAIVSGVNGSTGVAVVEAYALQP